MAVEENKNQQQINGYWAIFAKILMVGMSVVFPLVLSWAIWLTNEQMHDRAFRQSSERFSRSDALELRTNLVGTIEKKIDKVDDRVRHMEQDNARIITILERVEAKLDQ